MNPHLRVGLCALALTVFLAVSMAVVIRVFPYTPWPHTLVTLPMMPAFYLTVLLGLGGGTDGHPNVLYVFGLTVIVWWVILSLGLSLWRLAFGSE